MGYIEIEDDPFWDGTDGAHPAYWRGEDAATRNICKSLLKLINGGNSNYGYGYDPLKEIKDWIVTHRGI